MIRPCPTDRVPECTVPTPPVIELLFGEPDPAAPVLVLVTSECAPLAAAGDTWSQRDATLARRTQKLRALARLDGRVEAFDQALSMIVDTLSEPIFDPGGPIAIAARAGERPVIWEVALPEPPARITLNTYATPPHWLAHAAATSGMSGHDVAGTRSTPVTSATAVRVPSARSHAAHVQGTGTVQLIERTTPQPRQWRSPGPGFGWRRP